MEGSSVSVTEPSCPSCGETPMFRSQVHDCCVQVQAVRDYLVNGLPHPWVSSRAYLSHLLGAPPKPIAGADQ